MRVVGAFEPRVACAAALGVMVAALACGGGGSSTPAPAGGSGGPAPSDTGGSPAPSDTGGSPAPSDTGGSPAPSTTGGSPPSGDGGAAGSTGGSSSPAIQPGDAGTGASACAELAPAFGAAVERQFDTGTHRDCSVATTSAAGQVALGIGGAWGGSAGTMFDLYPSDGSVETGWVDGVVFGIATDQGQDLDPSFHPTSGGWAGIVHPGNANPLPFRTWDASGQLVAEIERFAVSTAPDRAGGSLLLAQAYDPGNTTSPPGATKLEWIDGSGRLTRAVTLDREARLVISNWATGHVVAVVPGSPASARWFDESGSPLTPWFDVGDVSSAPSLHLLLDGTVAIRAGDRWTGALTDGAASAGAAPGWLASRPSTRLATIRQGRGYAVLPMGGSAPGDATTFEIVAASGQSCGTFSIPPAAAQPGAVRKPRRLDVGQDGTLLQQSAVLLDPNPFGIHCAFRWWPALLR